MITRSILYLLVLMALPYAGRSADPMEALFAKANNQYAKSNYKDAVQTYQNMLNGGYQSAAVYFNLGNAYYKMGDLPSALLYYEKAHKLAPGDEDINFNIQLVNSKTTDKIEAAPELFLSKWWNGLILCCSANTVGILSVILFICGFGTLAYYLFAQSVLLKKVSFYSGLAFIFLGLLMVLAGAGQVSYFSSHRQAIVFSNAVTVKSEPGQAAKKLFVIHDGTKVDVLEKNDTWIRIRLANGNEGWILTDDVKTI